MHVYPFFITKIIAQGCLKGNCFTLVDELIVNFGGKQSIQSGEMIISVDVTGVIIHCLERYIPRCFP